METYSQISEMQQIVEFLDFGIDAVMNAQRLESELVSSRHFQKKDKVIEGPFSKYFVFMQYQCQAV